jgi:hypothetical protein
MLEYTAALDPNRREASEKTLEQVYDNLIVDIGETV